MKLDRLFRPGLIVTALLSLGGLGLWGNGLILAGNQPVDPQAVDPQDKEKTPVPASSDSENDLAVEDAEPGSAPKSSKQPEPRDAMPLIRRSIRLLRENSFRARIRQHAFLFDTELIASGTYLQTGGGKGGTRIELQAQTSHLDLEISLVNDGVYFFRKIRNLNESSEPGNRAQQIGKDSVTVVQRINLREVRRIQEREELWPGQWIALGGLLQFMEQVGHSFDFEPVQQKEIKGVRYDVIGGLWKPVVLAKLVPSQSQAILAGRPLNWERIHQQIPLKVEIYLIRQGALKGFPFRIIYYRPARELLEETKVNPILITEFSDPERIKTPSPTEFQFNANDDQVDDVTDRFIATLRQ